MNDDLAALAAEVRALREQLEREHRPGRRATLSVRQFCRDLHIDRCGPAVKRWIENKDIRTVLIGQRLRIPASELDRILRDGLPPLGNQAPRRRRVRQEHRGVPAPGVGDRIRQLTKGSRQ